MSPNLVPFMLEDVRMTPVDVISHLAEQVPGRNIGDRFVITARVNDDKDLELELDDGSKYTFQCRKVN
jgi:hypothetical protein